MESFDEAVNSVCLDISRKESLFVSLSLSPLEGRMMSRFRSKKPYETLANPPTENAWRNSFLRGRSGVLGVWFAAHVCAVTWSQSKRG